MRNSRWSALLSLVACLCAPPGFAQSAPEVGWWWNPNESGRGYFIESAGGIMYLAGYFYEGDGRATWLIAGGPNADPSFFQGRLQSFSHGQTLFGDYKPPAPAVDAGPVTVRFTDNRTGTITWPGGTIPIQRMSFGTGTADFQPLAGLWWNADESGRGYNLEVQGDTLFVNAFLYDAAGNPVWYLSAGRMTSPTTYEGPWLRFAGGQTMTGAYRPPSPPVEVARLAIAFLGDDEADFTFTTEDPVPVVQAKAETQRTTRATATFPRGRPFTFPKRYEGDFHYSSLYSTLNRIVETNFRVTAERLKLVEESTADPLALGCLPRRGNACKVYVAETQQVRLRVDQISPTFSGSCTGTLDTTVTIGPEDLRIFVYANSKYSGEFAPKSLNWTFLSNCTVLFPPYTFRFRLRDITSTTMPCS